MGLEIDSSDGEVLTAELAWPDKKVAVVVDDEETEGELRAAGWWVYRAGECSRGELVSAIGEGD